VGAGPLPLGPDEHRGRRPPIPIVPVDRAARSGAEGRGLGRTAVWLAGVIGADPPVLRTRTVDGESEATRLPPVGRRAASGPAMDVGRTAIAVDLGRECALRAAADAMNVVVGTGHGPSSARAASLAAVLTGVDPFDGDDPETAACLERYGGVLDGPLRILRYLGDPPTAVLCGAALGAGEHGLAFACDGRVATAGAAIAAAVEPDLRARLISVGGRPDPVERILLDHLGIERVTALAER
jgi:NaMN:DMB phosphoribosyltransferase